MLSMPFLASVFVEGSDLFYPKRVNGLVTRMLGQTQSGCNGPLGRELKITPRELDLGSAGFQHSITTEFSQLPGRIFSMGIAFSGEFQFSITHVCTF